MKTSLTNNWRQIKAFEFLISLPKSKLPSSSSNKLGYYDFFVCSKKPLKSYHKEMKLPAILSTGGEAAPLCKKRLFLFNRYLGCKL